MTLTDAGPLVALINADDQFHTQCADVLVNLPEAPLLTTLVCFTEAMYLLGRIGRFQYQDELWRWYSEEKLQLHDSTPAELRRMRQLMSQYEDTPMDLADASLVAAAETLGERRLFTLDSDFYVYRLEDGSALDIVS